jgi:polar amino acid transport system substrate-binding protein
MKSVPGSRLLPDNFFNVPQNIIVPMDKPEILTSINTFIDNLRTSGFLGDAVARSGVIGIEAAPKSLGSAHGCPG